jgi:AcrR family transcriptional regulator
MRMTKSSNPARRDQIIDAALTLFKQRGFAQVSTRDLAEQAGLARSHVYHYFADWQALRQAAFMRYAEEEIAVTRKLLAGLEPYTALTGFLKSCLPIKRDAAWALWMDAWDESLHDAQFAACFAATLQGWQTILHEIIAAGVAVKTFRTEDPARAARQILAMVNGYADDLLLAPSKKAAAQALQEVIQGAHSLLSIQKNNT